MTDKESALVVTIWSCAQMKVDFGMPDMASSLRRLDLFGEDNCHFDLADRFLPSTYDVIITINAG